MKKIIYRKSDLLHVGTIQENTTFEWEIEHNVIPNFTGILEDYDTVETKLTRFHLENVNGEIVAVEDGLSNGEKKQEILNQLEKSDRQLIRLIDELTEFCETKGFKPNADKKNIIDSRKLLRQQLNAFES